jgi:uncharacterized membrane protein
MKFRKLFGSKAGAGLTAALMAAALMGAMPVYAAEKDETKTAVELSVDEETETETTDDGEATETEAGEDTASSTSDQIDMSTDYPGITVKAGENVTFSLDFASRDGEGHDAALDAETLPDGWTGYFKGGSNQVTSVHVDGTAGTDDSGEGLVSYYLTIPAEAEEGTYEVTLQAKTEDGTVDTLNLEVMVTAEEVGESSFTSEYPEQQGATGSSFSFDTTIVNNRATEQTYSLSASVPEGWQVSFVPSGESTAVTSLSVEAGSSQGVTVSVVPSTTVEKGDYEIPCSAISANDTLKTDLSVSITGTYSLSLSTPTQRLSFDAYADKESTVTLTVTNTGNVDLTNVNLASSAPTDWDVTFSESTIDTLEAGASKEVTMYVTPSEDAITGDYVTSITVKNNETSASADFRVSVKTSTTWGIAAVAIIVVLIAALGIIFKKYGRR